jgi:hypothetical protein
LEDALNAEEAGMAFPSKDSNSSVQNMDNYVFRTDSNADILREEEGKELDIYKEVRKPRSLSKFKKAALNQYESISMSSCS